jgi:RimJ/RimL family protein N-acetyltransferase
MIEASNKILTLRTMTQKEMRALWRKYIPESGMPEYVYNEEAVDKRYEKTVALDEWNPTVGIFTKNDEIIGELTFARIVYSEKRCDLMILLANETYRNKGYGTEAVNIAKAYAKDKMGLTRIFVEVSPKNKRMQAVLKKCKFMHTRNVKDQNGRELMLYVCVL